MSPPRCLRILRISIICLIIVSCMGTTIDQPIQRVETVNGYFNLALLIGYTLSLFNIVKFSIPGIRAFLLIFIALVSLTIASTWVWRNGGCYNCSWRVDVGMDLPAMILVIVEAILTLRWEHKERRNQGLVGKRTQNQNEDEEEMGERGVLPPRGHILASDEQDHVEVTIPHPRSHHQQQQQQQQHTLKGAIGPSIHHQVPAQAYFPTTSPQLHSQQQHLHMYSANASSSSSSSSSPVGREELNEAPPRYSRK